MNGLTGHDSAIDEVCDDRLAFARAFLEFARQIHSLTVPSNTEMIARNVVSRCYYTAHHAIRALLMFHERGDTSGHVEAIEQFADVLKNTSSLKSKLASHGDVPQRLKDLLHNRHLADYYPYAAVNPKETPVDFPVAATDALSFVGQLVDKIEDYIRVKRVGRY